MSWVDVFVGFVVAHLVGDYLVQTDWQARNKFRGLSNDLLARRALGMHVATYTLSFVPVFVWIADDLSVGWAVLAAALVGLPHLVIDDGAPCAGVPASGQGRGGDRSGARRLGGSDAPRRVPVGVGDVDRRGVNGRTRRLRGLLLVIAALVVSGVGLLLEETDALRRLELTSVDLRFHIRGDRPRPGTWSSSPWMRTR